MNILAALVPALFCLGLLAQGSAPAKGKAIQDNSFLIEEAYNQEDGVVHHISTWQRFKESGHWLGSFTQEWPLGGQAHQLSYTLPVLRTGTPTDPRTGLGDLLLNYRYQWLGDGESRLAVSPRLSFLLPTGDRTRGLGTGALGAQVNLPLSLVLNSDLVAHTNAGYTWIPKARNSLGQRADLSTLNLGQNVIWLVHERFNVLLEFVHSRARSITGPGRTEWVGSSFLSPGIRGAFNLPGGLQIVPGIAIPIRVGSSSRERAVFLYLSFEHPFGKRG